MSHRNSTRRPLVTALIIATILTLAPAAAGARTATAGATTRVGVRSTVCDFDWRRSTYQLKRLIRCAARRWDVGPRKAIRIARCESRFDPEAYNPGGYAGVFQQATRYWPDRSDTYGFGDASVFNGRANIIVSVRMARRGGWGPWSCA